MEKRSWRARRAWPSHRLPSLSLGDFFSRRCPALGRIHALAPGPPHSALRGRVRVEGNAYFNKGSGLLKNVTAARVDGLVKNRHSGENRSPGNLSRVERTKFRLPAFAGTSFAGMTENHFLTFYEFIRVSIMKLKESNHSGFLGFLWWWCGTHRDEECPSPGSSV